MRTKLGAATVARPMYICSSGKKYVRGSQQVERQLSAIDLICSKPKRLCDLLARVGIKDFDQSSVSLVDGRLYCGYIGKGGTQSLA